MKKHISTHPITKERFVDNFNVDDFRYYNLKSCIRDIAIGLFVLLLYSRFMPLRIYMETLDIKEIIALACGYFLLTLGIMYIYVLPAVNKRYGEALSIVLPRHIMPIMIIYLIATVLPSFFPGLQIFSINDKLIVGTLQMLRIELLSGLIIFPAAFFIALRSKNKY